MTVEAPPREGRQIYHEGVPSNATLERFGLTRRPRFVVEIGFGATPIPLNGNLRFGEYRGFDSANGDGYPLRIGQHSYAYTVRQNIKEFQKLVRERRSKERIQLEEADVVRDPAQGREGIPLNDSVATEVYMGNVINAPFHKGDQERGDQERRAILIEAQRLLSSGGRLIIKASSGDDALYGFTPERTVQLLTETGFSIVDTCDNTQPEYKELETRYGRTPIGQIEGVITGEEDDPYFAYYIIAKKAHPVAAT